MKRPIAVTLSGILLFLISLGSILVAGTLVFVERWLAATPAGPAAPEPFSVAMMTYAVYGSSAFLALGAAWMIATGIGVLRLRSWARVSIIVLAALLAFFFGAQLAASVTMLVSASPIGGLGTPGLTLILLLGVDVLFVALAVWWIIYFNRRPVRALFISSQTASGLHAASSPSLRPLGITLIAWLLLSGATMLPFFLALSVPAMIFGFTFRGGAAKAVYAAWTVLMVLSGYALFKLRSLGYALAVATFLLSAVNMLVMYVVPGAFETQQAEMSDWMRSRWPSMAGVPEGPGAREGKIAGLVAGALGGACFVVAPLLYLLLYRTDYFAAVARARQRSP